MTEHSHDTTPPGPTLSTDVAIIGAGTGGLRARRAAAAAGARALLIEGNVHGTTCARVGCMPSKLLIAAADAAHHVRESHKFGVHAPDGPRIDGRAVLARVQRERDRFVGFVVRDVEALPPGSVLDGWARFVGPTTLQVGDLRIEAKAVVVATGSTPFVPEPLRTLGKLLISNEEVFELPDLPASVAVVGAGVIGLELGQALHRLGVRVRLFAQDERLGPISDPVVAKATRAAFSGEMTLSFFSPVQAAEVVPEGARLHWVEGGQPKQEVFERVLVAAGRRPSVGRLGIQGLTPGARGEISFDSETMQAGDLPIFFAGDVVTDRALLHEASDEGYIAGSNAAALALGRPLQRFRRRTPLTVVFTDPQLAVVGQGFRSLALGTFAAGEVDFGDQGRSRVMGRNKGHLRVYGAVGDGRLLGADICGPDAEHLAHLLAWSIQSGLTVTDALRMPFYHPVVEEGLRTALRDLARQLGLAHLPEVVSFD